MQSKIFMFEIKENCNCELIVNFLNFEYTLS